MSLVLAIAAAALPFTPPALIGDWYVGCDNGRHCAAVALLPEESLGSDFPRWYSLTVARSPGATDPPVISISTIATDQDHPPDYRLELVVDGRPTGLRFTNRATLDPQSDPLRAASLIAAARSIELANAGGTLVGSVSVDGARSALRLVDERQRRGGTVTAIADRGERPAGSVPLAEPLPRIPTPPRSQAAAATLDQRSVETVRTDYDCGDVADTHVPEFFRLDAANTLGVIPCTLGAQSASSVLVIVGNDRRYRAAAFDHAYYPHESEVPDPYNELVSPDFDAAAGILRVIADGPALGDCGGSEAYVWDGSRFRLAYQDLMAECRGSYSFVPVWRTQNVSARAPIVE